MTRGIEYDERYRRFLQLIMHKGSVAQQLATDLASECFGGHSIGLNNVISHINTKLSPLGMRLTSCACELTGENYYMVINTDYEEKLLFPSKYSTAQRSLLKFVFSRIIESEECWMSHMDCINLCNEIDEQINISAANDLLRELEKEKWVAFKDSGVTIGVRSIAELMPYFKATYGEEFVHTCKLCQKVVFYGASCESCKSRYHNYCLVRFARNSQRSVKCLRCNQEMQDLDTSGIVLDTQLDETCNEDFVAPRPVQRGGRSRVSNAVVDLDDISDKPVEDAPKKVRRSRIVDSDSEEEESLLSQVISQKKGRRTRK